MSHAFKPHGPLERIEIYAQAMHEGCAPLQVMEIEVTRPGLSLSELLPSIARKVSLKRFWAVLCRSNDRLMVQRLANGALRACP